MPTVPVEDITEYSWGFETFDGTYGPTGFTGEEGLDGWELAYPKADPDNYPDGDDVQAGGRTGDWALWNQDGAERVFTGLVLGHRYTFAFWFKHAYSGGGYGQINVVDGDGYADFGSAPAGEWVQWSLTFTATATSHTIQMMAYHGLTDDITLVHHIEMIVPVPEVTTESALYGDRTTTYRWEVLAHADGVDHLVGILDGVVDGAPALTWSLYSAVKGGGQLRVADLAEAKPGMLRVADISLESARLRPVCVIDGLPEIPLSVFLISSAVEDWSATGRVWALELLDRCTVPDQDKTEESYALPAGTLILPAVRDVLASAGEHINIDASVTAALAAAMVWPAGTSKLQIANDLLEAAGYSALWVDGVGAFQATPYVVPANRSTVYEVLGTPRELVDGEQAIYDPGWSRDRDAYEVPNKVIAIQSATGDDPDALTGVWTNEDPASPFSYPSRGRWITSVLEGVDVPDGTSAEITAFLEAKARQTLIAASSVQAKVQLRHLPVPIRVSDVLRFASVPAGVDARHVVTRIELEAHPLGMMRTDLQEVVDL